MTPKIVDDALEDPTVELTDVRVKDPIRINSLYPKSGMEVEDGPSKHLPRNVPQVTPAQGQRGPASRVTVSIHYRTADRKGGQQVQSHDLVVCHEHTWYGTG